MVMKAGRVIIGPGRPWDLLIVCLLVVAAMLLSITGTAGPLRWTIAFLAVFFCPGYAIVSALFPGRKALLSQTTIVRREEHLLDITFLERVVLGVGLSAAIMALAGTILTRGILNFTETVVGVETVLITFVASLIALLRRSSLPRGDQFAIVTHIKKRMPYSAAEMGVAVIIIAAVMVLSVVLVNGLNARATSEPYSEFAVTGSDGQLSHLPSVLARNQAGLIKVTVISHMGTSANFQLTLSLENTSGTGTIFDPSQQVTVTTGQPRSYSFNLDDGERWDSVISFVIPVTGEKTLYLTLNDGREVKTLWLPLTIT
ncbi:MAG: DUF1616 domain-containing protein [Methanomassiliicoccus sp.]|nr:DUF1616 domain-containing protein [Methanomassiliicoccus sp.]